MGQIMKKGEPMQLDHAKAIKGLSIAVIVLAALGIIVSIIGAIMMGIIGAAVSTYGPSYGGNYFDYDGFNYYYDTDDLAIMSLIMSVGSGAFVFAMICCIVVLVAGIIALRNGSNPQKLSSVFGWSIAGAIIGFLGCGFITTVLCIIIAVFANKDKRLYQAGQYGTYAPTGYGQPSYGAPIPPTPGAPMPPAQPIQPAATSTATPAQTQAAPTATPTQATPQAAPTTAPTTEDTFADSNNK